MTKQFSSRALRPPCPCLASSWCEAAATVPDSRIGPGTSLPASAWQRPSRSRSARATRSSRCGVAPGPASGVGLLGTQTRWWGFRSRPGGNTKTHSFTDAGRGVCFGGADNGRQVVSPPGQSPGQGHRLPGANKNVPLFLLHQFCPSDPTEAGAGSQALGSLPGVLHPFAKLKAAHPLQVLLQTWGPLRFEALCLSRCPPLSGLNERLWTFQPPLCLRLLFHR